MHVSKFSRTNCLSWSILIVNPYTDDFELLFLLFQKYFSHEHRSGLVPLLIVKRNPFALFHVFIWTGYFDSFMSSYGQETLIPSRTFAHHIHIVFNAFNLENSRT